MTEEQLRAFVVFKQRLIRAWVLDTEDSERDTTRKATRVAHDEANEAERAFRALFRGEV